MSQADAFTEYLVETEWVAEHLNDPNVRIVESDEDRLLYETGHIPGAVKVDWFTTLQHPIRRDFLTVTAFEALMSELGIQEDTTVVFYGDQYNWFACYALWLFRYYGHTKLKIMNGGRMKWVNEGRQMVTEIPSYPATNYTAKPADNSIRAFRQGVFAHLSQDQPLVDVRTPEEYKGQLLHMSGYPQEGAMRGGHIYGAVNIPWDGAVNKADGTFKSPDELLHLYQSQGITPDKEIITYCRIGERSSHTWFVLTYLLGYPKVKNYDGSWTEWGNLVNAMIER